MNSTRSSALGADGGLFDAVPQAACGFWRRRYYGKWDIDRRVRGFAVGNAGAVVGTVSTHSGQQVQITGANFEMRSI